MAGVASVKRLERAADHESRLDNYKEDEALRKRNAEAAEAGGLLFGPAPASASVCLHLCLCVLQRMLWGGIG